MYVHTYTMKVAVPDIPIMKDTKAEIALDLFRFRGGCGHQVLNSWRWQQAKATEH